MAQEVPMKQCGRTFCELITEFSELEKFSSVWQRWSGVPSATVFQKWPWMRAYWQAYGHELFLCSVAVFENGQVIGIVPLIRRGECIEFLGSAESDYNDLLSEPGREGEVLRATLEFLRTQPFQWRYGLLQNLAQHSRIARSVPFLEASLRGHLQMIFRSPSPAISINRDRPESLRALINKEQFRRAHKKLSRSGTLAFRHFETKDEARSHLDRFFYQHVTRWAMGGFRSQFLHERRRAFYQALIDEFDPASELRFGALELNSQPVGYHFGFQVDGKLIWYKPTFDVNYWDYSPGDLLLRALLDYAQQARLVEFDFCGGDEPYKYRFANEIRDNYDLYLEAEPASMGARCQRVARHALGGVRRKPEVKAILNRAIRRIQDTASHVRHLVRELRSGLPRLDQAWRRALGDRGDVLLLSNAGDIPPADSAEPVRSAQLDTLAALSVDYPAVFTEARLRDFRLRLKQSDQAFVVSGPGNEMAILWLGDRSGITVPDIPRFSDASLKRPSFVLYDAWMSPRFPAAEVLPGAVLEIARQVRGANLWIYCPKDRPELRLAAEYAGLRSRHTFEGRVVWRFGIAVIFSL